MIPAALLLASVLLAPSPDKLSALRTSQVSDPAADVLDVLGRVICGEARGEPQEGRYAVAWTLLNRWHKKPYLSLLEVAQQGGYALYCPFEDEPLAAARSYREAHEVLVGAVRDPTFGATHFYAPGRVEAPRWAFACDLQIGGHLFCWTP